MSPIAHPSSPVSHPSPETLLLLALGADAGGPGAARALAAHAEECGACGDTLDRILAARFEDVVEEVAPALHRSGASGAPARPQALARDSRLSPRAALGPPLLAAAADARTFDAPAPPALLGTAWLASGEGVSVFRRPDAPSTFALDRRDVFGRRVTIRAAAGASGSPPVEIVAEVDRFGRMRLAGPEAESLARGLSSGERLLLDPA